mgnify:CR=1 FL=1
MRVFFIRLAETAVSAVFCSAIISALFSCGLFDYTVLVCTIILGIAFALFAAFNVRNLCDCYFDMRSKALYYAVNLPSYAAFALITLVMQRALSARTFTWVFGIFKVISVATAYQISNFRSALIMHGVMFLVIGIIPFAVMLPEIEQTGAEMLPLVIPGSNPDSEAADGEQANAVQQKAENDRKSETEAKEEER